MSKQPFCKQADGQQSTTRHYTWHYSWFSTFSTNTAIWLTNPLPVIKLWKQATEGHFSLISAHLCTRPNCLLSGARSREMRLRDRRTPWFKYLHSNVLTKTSRPANSCIDKNVFYLIFDVEMFASQLLYRPSFWTTFNVKSMFFVNGDGISCVLNSEKNAPPNRKYKNPKTLIGFLCL